MFRNSTGSVELCPPAVADDRPFAVPANRTALVALGFAAGAACVLAAKYVMAYVNARRCPVCGHGDTENVHDRFGDSLATPDMNVVDEAAEQSFPCSDPPAFTSHPATPTQHE